MGILILLFLYLFLIASIFLLYTGFYMLIYKKLHPVIMAGLRRSKKLVEAIPDSMYKRINIIMINWLEKNPTIYGICTVLVSIIYIILSIFLIIKYFSDN